MKHLRVLSVLTEHPRLHPVPLQLLWAPIQSQHMHYTQIRILRFDLSLISGSHSGRSFSASRCTYPPPCTNKQICKHFMLIVLATVLNSWQSIWQVVNSFIFKLRTSWPCLSCLVLFFFQTSGYSSRNSGNQSSKWARKCRYVGWSVGFNRELGSV